MRRHICAIAAAGLLLCGLASQSRAQTTSQGLFGSRTVGGSGGLSAGGSTFAGGGQSAQGGGQGVLNNTIQGAGGQLQNARFQRENRTGQFVGAGAEDAANISRLLGGAAAAGALRQQFQQQGNQNRSQQPEQGRNRQVTYRVSRTVGFRYQPSTTSASLNARLAQRLRQSSRLQLRGPLEVAVQGQTVVLRGTVASDYGRIMAAQLALLQPGVYKVDNQLKVTANEPARLPVKP